MLSFSISSSRSYYYFYPSSLWHAHDLIDLVNDCPSCQVCSIWDAEYANAVHGSAELYTCSHAHRAAKIKLYSTIIPVLLVIWRRRRARNEPRRLLGRNPLFNPFHMLKHVKHGRRQTVESLRTLPDPYLIYDDSTFRRQNDNHIGATALLLHRVQFSLKSQACIDTPQSGPAYVSSTPRDSLTQLTPLASPTVCLNPLWFSGLDAS